MSAVKAPVSCSVMVVVGFVLAVIGENSRRIAPHSVSAMGSTENDCGFGATGDMPARPALGASDACEQWTRGSVHGHLRAFRNNAERDTCFRFWEQKNRHPRLGTSGV